MKLLILGGTVFLGRHLVEAALAAGHEVTLFNRGRHDAGQELQVERLRGDRDGNLRALHGRTWDAVVDTCGYVPRLVAASTALLSGAVGRYVFVSTISVYPDLSLPDLDEGSPVATMPDPSIEDSSPEHYGPLKALCERAASTAMPGRVLIVRPGLIVGPHDPTDRFTYWPRRVAEGGEVLAPGRPAALRQFIDVRDLAAWVVQVVEAGATGTFNATGPEAALSMLQLLEACRTVSGSDARFTWIPDDVLLESHVGPWVELPLWIPQDDMTVNCARAMGAGLRCRPLAETIRDTLRWDATRPADAPHQAGLAPDRERELLHAWHARRP